MFSSIYKICSFPFFFFTFPRHVQRYHTSKHLHTHTSTRSKNFTVFYAHRQFEFKNTIHLFIHYPSITFLLTSFFFFCFSLPTYFISHHRFPAPTNLRFLAHSSHRCHLPPQSFNASRERVATWKNKTKRQKEKQSQQQSKFFFFSIPFNTARQLSYFIVLRRSQSKTEPLHCSLCFTRCYLPPHLICCFCSLLYQQ